MPIYTYKCTDCDSVNDYLVKFTDPIPFCKNCGDDKSQEKLVSTNTGFCLMGHGWNDSIMNTSNKIQISLEQEKNLFFMAGYFIGQGTTSPHSLPVETKVIEEEYVKVVKDFGDWYEVVS